MRKLTFQAFVDRKKRETIRQLKIIAELLRRSGFKVKEYLDADEGYHPYIFCYNPGENVSFDGIRIYKVGNMIAFRIQNSSNTHPYGAAYSLPIEQMFHDFLSEKGMTPEKAGKQVMKAVAREIKNFFEKSAKAEEKEHDNMVAGIGNYLDAPIAQTSATGTDYSARIYSPG